MNRLSLLDSSPVVATYQHVHEHEHEKPCCMIVPPHIQKNLKTFYHHTDRTKYELIKSNILAEKEVRRHRSHLLIPHTEGFALDGEATIRIYDAKNRHSIPGALVREDSLESTGDITVDEAYEGARVTYVFFKSIFGRNSIDNEVMDLNSTVHYGQMYGNAFWNGHQMVYGDGDGEIFNRFTISPDIISHELTHGVTQYVNNLVYRGQSGALNESTSDVFGIMMKQFMFGETVEQSNWLIGDGLLTIKGQALRSMKDPGTAYDNNILGKDPQPGSMDVYVNTRRDHGGVHINSGIPNRAFYLVASKFGGYAWEKAGKIWYETLPKIRALADFKEFANATIGTAISLFGKESFEHKSVIEAWREVKVLD